VPCFALGTVATGFFKSTDFLPALSLTSVLADLTVFFSDFFSAFFSGLAMLRNTESRSKANVGAHKNLEMARELRQRGPDLAESLGHAPRVFFLLSTGNVGLGGKL
jgi:hypothetical protein